MSDIASTSFVNRENLADCRQLECFKYDIHIEIIWEVGTWWVLWPMPLSISIFPLGFCSLLLPPGLGLGMFDSTLSSFVSSWYYCLIVGVSNFCAFCLFLAFLFYQLLLIQYLIIVDVCNFFPCCLFSIFLRVTLCCSDLYPLEDERRNISY